MSVRAVPTISPGPGDASGTSTTNASRGDSFAVFIAVNEMQGLDDLRPGTYQNLTPLTVGSRDAAQVETFDVCSIYLYVSESSSVDASAVGSDTSNVNDFDSCGTVSRLAELIEPALPLR
jgi:hypothetical protein